MATSQEFFRAALPFLVSLVVAGCKSDLPPAIVSAPKIEGDRIIFPSQSPQLRSLTLDTVMERNETVYRLTGRIVWDEDRTVRIYSPFAGRVDSIRVKLGEQVRAGQALATIGSPDFGQTQADFHKAETDFALVEKTLARQRELLDHGVAPAKDVQSAEADFQRARSELARVRSRASLYGTGSVDQRFPLRSPLAGVVVEKNVNPGQEVRPDQMTANIPPLFVVTDPLHLWAQLDATEHDLSVLTVGQTVMLRTPAYPETSFTARIESIADFIDPVSRMIKVRAAVDNSERRLKGEMFITAQIQDDKHRTLTLPAASTFLVGKKYYAFVEQAEGQFARVEIDVGKEAEGRVSVSGVQAGQRVVTTGALLLERLMEGGS